MASGGFTLADRLGAKAIPCRVSGCARTFLRFAKPIGLGRQEAADPNAPTAGMCDPCREQFGKLVDLDEPCECEGCQGTWTWGVMAQLEAFASRHPVPKGLCAACAVLLASFGNKEVGCSVPGCARTVVLTPRSQLLDGGSGAAAPRKPEQGGVSFAGPLCTPCAEVAHRLKDRPVPCGIAECTRKWIWRADEQIQTFAAGKPNEPPRRMCAECRAEFGKLLDREVRCRTSGCNKVWTWTRGDQLDVCVAGKPPLKAPARMCQSCFELWSGLKDIERHCRKSGCKRTWTDKRGAQLARAVRGKTGDPYPRYCSECDKDLGDLEDREMPCKTEGCTGTWTWSREQQLAAGVRPRLRQQVAAAGDPPSDAQTGAGSGALPPTAEETANAQAAETVPTGARKGLKSRWREPRPPERRCSACAEFLASRKTQEIPCSQCGTPVYWPPESQLQTHLGNWAIPGLCGACKRDAIEAARRTAREAIRQELTAHRAPGIEPGSS